MKMVWRLCLKSRSIISSTAVLRNSIVNGNDYQRSGFSSITNSSAGFPRNGTCSRTVAKPTNFHNTKLGSRTCTRNLFFKSQSTSAAVALDQERTTSDNGRTSLKINTDELDPFEEMKQRFLHFKKHKYLKEMEQFRNLAEAQSPKFMVIACADSRVCPSIILGLQPGETFMIRNVANLVPPLENGPSETNAALEFAVNTLRVQNILVIGHSGCGGIQSLMSMQDDDKPSSFTEKWVVNAKIAKLKTIADSAHLSFEQKCRQCEKESINRSLLNLLTYKWIEDKVRKELLFLHGGYYNFINCTFEKWTFDYKTSIVDEGGTKYSFKDHSLWC